MQEILSYFPLKIRNELTQINLDDIKKHRISDALYFEVSFRAKPLF